MGHPGPPRQSIVTIATISAPDVNRNESRMTAAKRDLHTEQGATFRLGFTWAHDGPIVNGEVTPGAPYWTDPAGITAAMQIRAQIKTPALVDATTENEMITLGPDGRVDILLLPSQTDALDVPHGFYDLEIQLNPIDRPRVLQGQVFNDLNVTRST